MDSSKDNQNEIKTNNKTLALMEIIGMFCFAIVFYIACYMLFPHGEKLLFFVLFIFILFIPFIPLYLIDNKSKKFIACIYCVLSIPIILIIVYLFKYSIIAKHNYVLPGAKTLKFKVEKEWRLVNNSGVGDEWKKKILIETDLDEEGNKDQDGVHVASINSDINIEAYVREDDSYDDDDDRGFDLDFDEFSYNNVIFPATPNFGKEQVAKVGISMVALNQNKDGSGDHGTAQWECTIKVKRLFDVWEVLKNDLNYSNINTDEKYVLGKIGGEGDKRDYYYEDGSVERVSSSYYDYIYYTYDDVTMIPMSSSAISEIGYSQEYDYLLIRFVESEELYGFVDVPEELFGGLATSSSPGRFFNEEIRDYYSYLRLE